MVSYFTKEEFDNVLKTGDFCGHHKFMTRKQKKYRMWYLRHMNHLLRQCCDDDDSIAPELVQIWNKCNHTRPAFEEICNVCYIRVKKFTY